MKKVLHILNTGLFSGAENVAIKLIESTKGSTECVYLSPEGPISRVLEERSIRFYPVPTLTVSNIKKAIKEIKPDIIHAHDFTAGVFSAFATFKIPIINHLHNGAPWRKNLNLKTLLYSGVSFKFKRILTVSDSVIGEFVFNKALKRKTVVIGNPVDTAEVLNLAKEDFLGRYDVAFLGRLKEEKNPELFVDIIKKVTETKPSIKAVIIGGGELKSALQEKIKSLGLCDNIDLLGFVKNPLPILKNCKILCMPSRWEGFGLSAVEALSLSLPVVAANVGGLADLIDDSCGRLCTNISQYTDEICKLLENKEYYKEKSDSAKEKSIKLNNIKQYTDEVLKIYNSL